MLGDDLHRGPVKDSGKDEQVGNGNESAQDSDDPQFYTHLAGGAVDSDDSEPEKNCLNDNRHHETGSQLPVSLIGKESENCPDLHDHGDGDGEAERPKAEIAVQTAPHPPAVHVFSTESRQKQQNGQTDQRNNDAQGQIEQSCGREESGKYCRRNPDHGEFGSHKWESFLFVFILAQFGENVKKQG